jgi:voltage-gated potassium channel
MYFVEGPANGFRNIPVSIYWAIVTLTTVGFGDITPQTPLGQVIASTLMILGYGIIAVPTGIVSAEMVRSSRALGSDVPRPRCDACRLEEHESDAVFCRVCGSRLVLTGASGPSS